LEHSAYDVNRNWNFATPRRLTVHQGLGGHSTGRGGVEVEIVHICMYSGSSGMHGMATLQAGGTLCTVRPDCEL
jgi:hypothetical protein